MKSISEIFEIFGKAVKDNRLRIGEPIQRQELLEVLQAYCENLDDVHTHQIVMIARSRPDILESLPDNRYQLKKLEEGP